MYKASLHNWRQAVVEVNKLNTHQQRQEMKAQLLMLEDFLHRYSELLKEEEAITEVSLLITKEYGSHVMAFENIG